MNNLVTIRKISALLIVLCTVWGAIYTFNNIKFLPIEHQHVYIAVKKQDLKQ